MPVNSVAAPAGRAGTDRPASRSEIFDRLMAAQRHLGILTIVVVMAVYVGFFVLVAFAPAWLSSPVPGCGSLAFLVMALMFVAAWAITWLYLRHTQRVIAPLEAAAREALLTQSDPAFSGDTQP